MKYPQFVWRSSSRDQPRSEIWLSDSCAKSEGKPVLTLLRVELKPEEEHLPMGVLERLYPPPPAPPKEEKTSLWGNVPPGSRAVHEKPHGKPRKALEGEVIPPGRSEPLPGQPGATAR